MKQIGLHFVLIQPASFRELVQRLGDEAWYELVNLPGVGTLHWPPAVETAMLEFLRDRVLRAHAGSAARAWSVLRRPYQGTQWPHPRALGNVPAQERHRFLGGRPARLVSLPPDLAGQVDLGELSRTFNGVLEAFRHAPADVDLLLISVELPDEAQRPASLGGLG
jgi:hypothetical protein